MKIEILLFTLIVLLPSSYQLPSIALPISTFYITIVEMIAFVLVFLWLMRFLFSGGLKRGRSLFAKYVTIILCLYAAYILVGLFERNAIMVLGDFRQYMPLALYFPLLHSLSTQEKLEKLRHALFISLIVISVYTIIIFVFFKDHLIVYAIKGNTGFTGERIFIDNSVFLFFTYLGYMIAQLFAGQLGIPRRLFYLVIISLSILLLVIMQVRTFWMMTLIILVLSFLSLKGFVHKFKYASIAVTSILLATMLIFLTIQATGYRSKTIDSIEDRLASFSDLSKVGQKTTRKAESVGSVDTRLATAKHAMNNYIAQNWMFGLGFGGQIPMVNYLGAKGLMKYQIDNGYLTLLVKFGAFGMLFYAIFTLKIITSLFRIIFNPIATEEDVMLSKSFLYAIVAMAAGSFFTSIFIREQVCIVSFVIMLCEIELINSKLIGHNMVKMQGNA